MAFTAVQTQNKKVIALCENYLNFVGIQNGLQVAAVMSVIVVNIAYVVVAKKLGAYESHASLDGQYWLLVFLRTLVFLDSTLLHTPPSHP